MPDLTFLIYLFACAGVTYLIRMLPLVLIKKKITNRWLLSFLYYVPYAVLSAMTVPAVFYSTGNITSAIVGFAVSLVLAWLNQSLLVVAAGASVGVLITELVTIYLLPLL